MSARPLLRGACDRLLWERAVIQSRIRSRVLDLAADFAKEEGARCTEGILRQLSQAAAEPEFRNAHEHLTNFAARARAAHYPALAAAMEAVVTSAARLTAEDEPAPTLSVLRGRSKVAASGLETDS